jgi:hypothetical protein
MFIYITSWDELRLRFGPVRDGWIGRRQPFFASKAKKNSFFTKNLQIAKAA